MNAILRIPIIKWKLRLTQKLLFESSLHKRNFQVLAIRHKYIPSMFQNFFFSLTLWEIESSTMHFSRYCMSAFKREKLVPRTHLPKYIKRASLWIQIPYTHPTLIRFTQEIVRSSVRLAWFRLRRKQCPRKQKVHLSACVRNSRSLCVHVGAAIVCINEFWKSQRLFSCSRVTYLSDERR